jgi:penicillin-binding protein 1A
MVILKIIQWLLIKFFVIIKGLLFLILLFLLCITAFVNGFLSEVVKDLPMIENLGVPDLAMTSKIYASDGTLLGDVFGEENRVLIGWHQIPEDLRSAIVAVEDQDYYSHPGFDIKGMARALIQNLQQGSLKGQGASTVTQQLVRALYLSNEQTFERKIAEIILAVKIEQKYSKDEILTFYLNQVYFGSNAYGVEAASQTYFGQPVSECDIAQCAMLAGLPQAPSRLSPYVSMENAIERREHVLTRMLEEGYIDQDEFLAATESEIILTGRRDVGFTGLTHPYFSTYVIHEVQEKFGLRKLYTEGLRIYTTLNPDWQAVAEQTVIDKVAEFADLNVTQGALVTIEVQTGAIRAMVGGTNFDDSEFNRAWQANRQPGSSFKPYVYSPVPASNHMFT